MHYLKNKQFSDHLKITPHSTESEKGIQEDVENRSPLDESGDRKSK